jgi:hypothetical protein
MTLPAGSTTIVYVPATVNFWVSMYAPAAEIVAVAIGVDDPGGSSETVPDVTALDVVWRLTRWLTLPVNVSRTFWPGVLVVDETALPPALIVPVTSATV